MSTLNVDKVDPSSGTALELGTSGDTITVPTGAGLTVVDEVKTNKVSPATGTAFALGDSGDTFTVPSGATIVNSGTATGFGITAASFRPNVDPIIINGNMSIAQRNTSFTGITSSGFYTVDRLETRETNGGTWTQTQDTNVPSGYGFKTALKMDCTTADASLGAADLLSLRYTIEAQDCQVFDWGTNARAITVAFWVKATKTGTNILELFQTDSSRICCQAYTIDTTDTWEFKVLNFPADTSGSANDDNGSGLQVRFWMAAGTDWTSGTLATTWAANTDANRAVGQVNNADSTSNNFHITALQLEAAEYTSSTIPPFQHESYGNNLKRCGRYYEKLTANNSYADFSHQMITTSTTSAWGAWFYSYPKRIVPTFGISDVADFAVMKPQGGRNVISAFTLDPHSMMIGTDAMNTRFYVTTTNTVLGEGGFLCANNTSSGYLTWDAEL